MFNFLKKKKEGEDAETAEGEEGSEGEEKKPEAATPAAPSAGMPNPEIIKLKTEIEKLEGKLSKRLGILLVNVLRKQVNRLGSFVL